MNASNLDGQLFPAQHRDRRRPATQQPCSALFWWRYMPQAHRQCGVDTDACGTKLIAMTCSSLYVQVCPGWGWQATACNDDASGCCSFTVCIGCTEECSGTVGMPAQVLCKFAVCITSRNIGCVQCNVSSPSAAHSWCNLTAYFCRVSVCATPLVSVPWVSNKGHADMGYKQIHGLNTSTQTGSHYGRQRSIKKWSRTKAKDSQRDTPHMATQTMLCLRLCLRLQLTGDRRIRRIEAPTPSLCLLPLRHPKGCA